MPNFIQEIYDFNKQAGLLEKGYDDFLESSFQIEEALEGFNLITLTSILSPNDKYLHPKELSRIILNKVGESANISDVDRLDKAIDAIIFAVGSIAKLKLTPEQIVRAISVVTNANLQKLSMPKDEFGKLTKPVDFVGPEVELQKILDERQ